MSRNVGTGRLRLAIFDMDGTLIDSAAMICAAMARAFERHGHAPPAAEKTRAIIGLSLSEAVARLGPQLDAPQIAAVCDAYKASFVQERAERGGEAATPLFEGARAALARLEAAGWLLSVATGKARRGLDHALDAHDMRRFFIAPQSADDAPSKPHPGMIENILRATGAAAADAVMIGDASFDMQMARAAGASGIGVSWGNHPPEALRAAGAATVIDSFDALDAALEGL